MKKILLFTLISALLATSMASCKVEPKEDEVGEDEVGNDEVIEDEVTDDEVIEDEVIEDEMVKESEAKTVDGIPKELYDTYGFSVIHPEKDDYSYIRINFDESREISGYAKLGIGYAFGEDIGYIDSNGAFYSGLPEGGKYSYLRDWQDAEVPDIEGVDAVAASPYGGNLLMFSKDGKYGYLNTDGEIVIEAQFYEARPFSDGLAAVCREYGDCLEYINESGETALKFEDANGYYNIFQMSDEEPSCDFSDGVALVYCGNEGFCIDKQGNRLNVKNPVGMHKQGRIAFYDEETKLYGFADKYGNIVIPAVYHGVFDFSQSGIALVKSTRNYNIPEEAQKFEVANYYRGYIDTEGNVVIPIEFEQPWWYYGTKGLIEPFESYGVVSLYKQGYIYYYRYDGTLLGKKPRMAYVSYENESYKINVAEYWQWVNDGKAVG